MKRVSSWVLRTVLAAAAVAGVFGLPPSVLGAPPRLAVQILTPSNGAVLSPGKGWVLGKVADPAVGQVEIDVNGKVKQTAPVMGGVFYLQVYFSQGKNVLRVFAGDREATVAVVGAEKHSYHYHPEVERCTACHGETPGGYGVQGPKDAVCYRCHDRQDKGKLLHGPMGNGDCTACHDPHGSAYMALTVAKHETLCVTCHDQKASESHFRKSKGKPCTSCHDPHSSDKAFLQK